MRSLTSMPLDLTVDERRAARHGGLGFIDANANRLSWLRITSGDGQVRDAAMKDRFGDRVTLRPTTFGVADYVTGDAGASYFRTYRRTVPQAKQWVAIELLYNAPANTSVAWLLDDGADVLRWDGAGWVATDPAVEANWNSEAEIMAGFSSWAGTTLAVLARLETADAEATPVVYGARALVRFWSPSPVEDLLYRTVVPHLKQTRVPVRFNERATGAATIDLSNLETYTARDRSGASLLTPFAVFNLATDPNEDVDLFVAWDPATSVVTMSGAQVAGHDLRVEANVEPEVIRRKHRDYTEVRRFPSVVIEGYSDNSMPHRERPKLVRDRANLSAYQVPHPETIVLRLDLVAVARYDTDVHRLTTALDALPRFAASLVTGETVSLRRVTDWAFRDGERSARSTWEAKEMIAFRGADSVIPIVGSFSFGVAESTG